MSAENGINIYSYISSVFFRYCKDQMIFVKALQYAKFYEESTEFPFNALEMDEVIAPILGESFIWMGFTFGKYFKDKDFVWDPFSEEEPPYLGEDGVRFNKDDVAKYQENFEVEIKSFYKASKNIINKIMSPSNVNGLLKGIFFENETFDSGRTDNKIVRIIRTDDSFLDLKMTPSDATEVIYQIYKHFGKENINKESLDLFGHLPGDFPIDGDLTDGE